METDFLRLILFFVGIVVVLVIYFWERHKRVNAQIHAIRNAEQRVGEMRDEVEADKQVVIDEYQNSAESEFDEQEAYEPDMSPRLNEVAAPDAEELSQELNQLSELVAEESALRLDQAEQMPLFSEAEEILSANKAKPKVVVINVVSHRAGFNGKDVLDAAADAGLELGEMDIFHRYCEAQRRQKAPLFSMASMVEPGTFPLDKMDEFVTPGLALFVQISGGQGGLALYDEMLMAAEKLTECLGGELQDAMHSTLTRQAIEFQREEIIEFQRRQMLAKSNR